MHSSRLPFATLVTVVAVSGISQGLTLPLLALLLEQQGIPTITNGINGAAMYVGTIVIAPFFTFFLHRFGYRSTLIISLCLIIFSTALLPLTSGLAIWFILRMIMGIGDSLLHYVGQTWMAIASTQEQRGRSLSLYGLSYGIGFSVGPLGINLLPFGLWAPFLAVGILYVIGFLLVLRIDNVYPENIASARQLDNPYAFIFRYAWLALIPSFVYGYLEVSLNSSFPIYGLRIGLTAEQVSIVLPAFIIGSLFLQVPLGTLSDRYGRKRVMMISASIATVALLLFPAAADSVWLMMLLLAIAGAMVGSFFSLGLAFAADILPAATVPAVGIIASVNFSTASIIAPSLNGYLLSVFPPGLIFYIMSGLLLVFVVAGLFFRVQVKRTEDEHMANPLS